MILEREGRCDCCNALGATDMHELVNRGRTKKGSAQRELSYRQELCSLLCRLCHDKAHNPEVRDLLFHANYRRYGRDVVVEAFAHLEKAAGVRLGIVLPEERSS